ncbi:outer membrane beta-barrel protein [Chryseobacterium sp. RLHN22]|uniref:outer membrane beta-barrel protein n=1 Tax=Chryseobacterium sp. RLHN22 TaxID=3437885 RepID=UPI003D9BE12A
MKKLLVAGAVALFGLSNAQIAKGTVYLSGQAQFSQQNDNNDDSKNTNVTIVPTVGYFVAPNLAVGLGVGFQHTNKSFENTTSPVPNVFVTSEGKNIDNAVIVEPFVRKYWTLGDKLYFFGQLSVPMAFGSGKEEGSVTTVNNNVTPATTTTTTISEDKAKFTSVGVSIKPGLDYFLNKNWTIEATIGEFGYNTKKYDFDGAKSVENFNFGANLSTVTIGVKYVFAK